MASERKLVNVTECCRLCLVDNGFMISLHDELVESKLKDLTKCTCIDVSLNKKSCFCCIIFNFLEIYLFYMCLEQIKQEDHLPHSVCHICLYKLNMWTEFKDQFIKSNKTLFKQFTELTEVFDDAVSLAC